MKIIKKLFLKSISFFSIIYNNKILNVGLSEYHETEQKLNKDAVFRISIVSFFSFFIGGFYFISEILANNFIIGNLSSDNYVSFFNLLAEVFIVAFTLAMFIYSIFCAKGKTNAISDRIAITTFDLALISASYFFIIADFLGVKNGEVMGFSPAILWMIAIIILYPTDNILNAIIVSYGLVPYLFFAIYFGNDIYSPYQYIIISLAFTTFSLYFRCTNYKLKIAENRDKISRSKLQNMAYLDNLTKASNRYFLDTFLEENLDKWAYNKVSLTLFIFDIDDFKLYNDNFSHLKGDEILVRVYNAVANTAFKETTTVYRYGGEEFIVIINNIDDDQVVEYGTNICRAVMSLKIDAPKNASHKYLTVSVGASKVIVDNQFDFKKVFEIADQNLYKAKTSGKNAVCFNDNVINLDISDSHY